MRAQCRARYCLVSIATHAARVISPLASLLAGQSTEDGRYFGAARWNGRRMPPGNMSDMHARRAYASIAFTWHVIFAARFDCLPR